MCMRGTDQQQSHVFSYISPEQRVRKDHPLRPIRTMVDDILKQLSPQFNKMYAKVGRPSIPPEQLLRAQLLQMLYSVRSERLLMEEMDYNILFRWFVGLNLDDPVWDATVFTIPRLGFVVVPHAVCVPAASPRLPLPCWSLPQRFRIKLPKALHQPQTLI